MKKEEMVSLATLGRGAAIESFDREFGRLLENALDPNTTTAKREIMLRVIVQPNEDRNFCTVQVHCKSKLSADKPFATQMFIGRDAQGVKATEHNPQQIPFGFVPGKLKEET